MTTTTDAASELFAVADLLAGQAMLRRSLSDPSASPEQRAALSDKLLRGKVSDRALAEVAKVARESWPKAAALVSGVERAGVILALEGAGSEGALERVAQELYTVGKAVGASAELTSLLRSPAYEVSAKRALLGRLTGDGVHPVTRVLVERAVDGHRRVFAATIEDYIDIAADLSGVVVAKVTVARPLDEARAERLRAGLMRRVGRPVLLQVDIDESVLGGINVAIGHDVYESTVAGRLDDVRRQLINS